MSPDPCPYFDAIAPSATLTNSYPPYTAPIAAYAAQRTQMSAAIHRPNRAQMGDIESSPLAHCEADRESREGRDGWILLVYKAKVVIGDGSRLAAANACN